MGKHFLLDTRTSYQKMRDWICSLFRSKPKEIEIQRIWSSPERRNRSILHILNTTRPIGQDRDLLEDSLNISHKKHVCQSPSVKAVERKSLIQYPPCSKNTRRSSSHSPVRISLPVCSAGGSMRDSRGKRHSSQ